MRSTGSENADQIQVPCPVAVFGYYTMLSSNRIFKGTASDVVISIGKGFTFCLVHEGTDSSIIDWKVT
jgi:hypothetical protein